MAHGRIGCQSVNEVVIYMEGGGTGQSTKADLRRGMDKFLDELKKLAEERSWRWKLVCCGGRDRAFKAFKVAQKHADDATVVLLVDAEGPVACSPFDHLVKEEWDLRMAVYAAMIDRVDQGIGALLATIRERRDPDNTVIMFLSDNGACAESHDPVPDVPAGPRESDTACFLPWANASNTPFRLFKHWLHEGGSATPFIVHYPKLIREGRIESGYYAHVKDIMASVLDLAGARYPSHARGYPVLSTDSRSLVPNLKGVERENPETLFLEHEGNRAVRHGRWKLVSYYSEPRGFTAGPVGRGRRTGPWELYDMEADRVELHDVAAAHPQLRDRLIEEYGRFSERTGVADWERIQRDLEPIYRE